MADAKNSSHLSRGQVGAIPEMLGCERTSGSMESAARDTGNAPGPSHARPNDNAPQSVRRGLPPATAKRPRRGSEARSLALQHARHHVHVAAPRWFLYTRRPPLSPFPRTNEEM